MKYLHLLTALLMMVTFSTANAMGVRNVPEYNLQNGLGLKGYDPVAVFPEGGGAAMMGQSQFGLDYMGVMYYFSSAENMKAFMANPEKYEPTYGGWCAYAMANGSKVDIQPTIFTINGNRAHYFVSSRAKSNFDRDVADHEQRADSFWKQFSGEDPRL